MSKYQQFIFNDYEFNRDACLLSLHYSYDNVLNFRETYRFDFDFVDYDPDALDRALELLFFMAGVSYYKMYLAPEIVINKGQVDTRLADFLGKTYQKGLGEFFFKNNLAPTTSVVFPKTTEEELSPVEAYGTNGILIGLGGGKDSLVSVELLKDNKNEKPNATWSLNHRSQLEPLVERVGLKHLWVEREWDEQIKALNQADALNGHIPISAIFACVGTIVSVLSGYRDAVVSNESSASEPTMQWQGVDINHQYSKSLEFESDYQAILQHTFGNSLRYYSFLRPFSELRIAELFAKLGFDKYQDVFSSCNRAYTHDQHHMFWCGECPKCAFVFLILIPFIDQTELVRLWGGKNLLQDPSLEPTYRQLLGIEGDKPFDCVGEVKEARAAMRLAQELFPELNKYQFDIPEDYDFRSWSEHSMPSEIFAFLKERVSDQ